MLDRIKSLLFGTPKISRTERAKSYPLDDKPFTKALVLRASKYQDDAEHRLKETLGRIKPITEANTFEEFVASCAVTVAYYVACEAAKNVDYDPIFLPLDSVPEYGPMVVAFSLFILAGIQGQLKAEGTDLDFRDVAANTASLFFMAHPDEDRAKYAVRGVEAFRTIALSDKAGVKRWHDGLMELIPIYMMQWTTTEQKLREVDCISLFGKLLRSLLSAVE